MRKKAGNIGGQVWQKSRITLIEKIVSNAVGLQERIVVPETSDIRVVKAVAMAAEAFVGKIVILGKSEKFEGVLSKKVIKNLKFVDNQNKAKKEEYAKLLVELRKSKGMTIETARQWLEDPMYFAAMMVKAGEADGIVAGATMKTEDVLRPAFQIIKTAPGHSIASSAMILQLDPNSKYGENGILVLGDCAVIENPTAEQLAEIAIQTADTAKTITGINPKVAMLSYSTKSDRGNPTEMVEKVKDAYLLVRRKNSSLVVDGELQVDAAIDPDVAKIKCPRSTLEGRANVLIFPDLNSGNIAYKLSQRLSNAHAIGPIIQGLAKPVNDLSRGATVEEIFVNIAITVIMAAKNKGENKK